MAGGGAEEGAGGGVGSVVGVAGGPSDWEDVEDTTGWLILSDPLCGVYKDKQHLPVMLIY